ncbi:acyltransferase [soil metagenome]
MVMQRGDRLEFLDGVRGIAAIAVVLQHIAGFYQFSFATGGYLAVDLFFILSGFVIAWHYDEKLLGGMRPLTFMRHRIVRLYPLFALGLALGVVKSLGRIAFHAPDALSMTQFILATVFNTVILPAPFVARDLFPHNGPLWSLFFEVVINIAYAWAIVRMPRPLLIALCVAGAAGMILGIALDPPNGLDVGWNLVTAPFGLARVTFGFVMGMLIARRYREHPPTYIDSAPHKLFLLAVMLAAFLSPLPKELVHLRDGAFALLFAPLMILMGARLSVTGVAQRLMGWLGFISYPLYALHFPIMSAMCFALQRSGVDVVTSCIVTLATTIIVAHIAGIWFDPPIRKLLGRVIEKRGTAPSLA